jgi:hypothetical protein
MIASDPTYEAVNRSGPVAQVKPSLRWPHLGRPQTRFVRTTKLLGNAIKQKAAA